MSKRADRRKKAKGKSQVQKTSVESKKAKSSFLDMNYKKLLIIPFLILILAIVQIGFQTVTTGDFINKGVSLSGGTSITIEDTFEVSEVQTLLESNFESQDILVRGLTNAGRQVAIVVETTAIDQAEIDSVISVLEENYGEFTYNVEKIGSSLGDQFFRQTFTALIIAFVLMGIVVFIYFKTFVPSLAVILSAFSDIIVTAAVVNLLGIKLSTAGVAAFLMLIGYSVDTDILLTTKLLKGKKAVSERLLEAFKTGMTMTLTTIFAVIVALIFTESLVIKQIMAIVLIGLLIDMINTWIQNAGILRWYVEKKEAKQK